MAYTDFKIFNSNRISLMNMRDDVFNYIRSIYASNGSELTMASPFVQILNVVVNLGRMILFYIENMITELNINTAYNAKNVYGIIELTGHRPSRAIGARGSVYMSYNMDSRYAGKDIVINNYTKIKNNQNNLVYTMILPSSMMQITVGAHDSKIEIPIIQGFVKRQQATGTGEGLQSFNFANRGGETVDNFFINVYVNGERWKCVDSMLDMSYDEKACMVRSSLNGGIDVFFGTGNSGAMPPTGASIICEYLVTNGADGNITEFSADSKWEFVDYGYDIDGDYIDLNEMYSLQQGSEILFGTNTESLLISKRIAPKMSRSFVLANDINYKYFLSKLNMFSIIDAFSGFSTNGDVESEDAYTTARNKYDSLKESYMVQCGLTGKDSTVSERLKGQVDEARKAMELAKSKYEAEKMDDNIIYLYLVPDVSKRFARGENYFTCPVERFSLTDDEKSGILSLINSSGQRILTTDNKIIDPMFVRFSINIFIQMLNGYVFHSVKSSIVSAISQYLTSGNRRDRIPLSDIIKTVEGVDGVDSVTAFFDADVKNSAYFGEGKYGIDEYGDIVLKRDLHDRFGNSVMVGDLIPLFRGPFTSPSGVEYDDDINSLLSTVNITLRGVTDRPETYKK